VAKDAGVQKHLDQILSSTQNAAEFSRNVLAFSHPNTDTVFIADIEQSLREIEPLRDLSLARDIELEFKFDATDPVPLDSTSFTDAVLAIVTNAGQAIPDSNGLIKIRTFKF